MNTSPTATTIERRPEASPGQGRRSLARDVSLMFVVSVIVALLNLLTGLYVARLLPVADYGRLVYFSNLLLTAMLLVGFGLTTFVTGEVARLVAIGPAEDMSGTFYSILAARLVTTLPLPILGLCASVVAGDWIYLAASLGAVLATTLDFCVGAVRGAQKVHRAAAIYLAQPLLYLGMLGLTPQHSVEGIIGALLLSYVVALLFAGILLLNLEIARRERVTITWRRLWEAINSAGIIYLIVLVQMIYSTYALLWLGSLGRYTEAALLSIYLTIARMFPLALVPVVGTVIYPRLCVTIAKGNILATRRDISESFEIAAALTFCATVVMVMYPSLIVELLYSTTYLDSAYLLQIAAPLCVILTLENLLSYTLLAIRKPRVALAGLVVRLVLFAVAATIIVWKTSQDATAFLMLAYLGSSAIGLLVELGYYLWWSKYGLPLLRLLGMLVVFVALAAVGRALLPDLTGSILVRAYKPVVTAAVLFGVGGVMFYLSHRSRVKR